MAAAAEKQKFYEKLSEREKIQLAFLGVFLTFMASIVAVIVFQRAMEDIDSSTRQYQAALDYIAVAGPEYAERASAENDGATHKNVDDESLKKNTIKLTSFIAEQAEKANIDVSSYDEDELPFGNKKDGGPIIIEKQLRVEIRKAQMAQLMDLLDRVHQSPQPVFIKRLDVRAQRKTPGEVRAVVTVSTYVKKEEAQ